MYSVKDHQNQKAGSGLNAYIVELVRYSKGDDVIGLLATPFSWLKDGLLLALRARMDGYVVPTQRDAETTALYPGQGRYKKQLMQVTDYKGRGEGPAHDAEFKLLCGSRKRYLTMSAKGELKCSSVESDLGACSIFSLNISSM